jgi:hypothetical protein
MRTNPRGKSKIKECFDLQIRDLYLIYETCGGFLAKHGKDFLGGLNDKTYLKTFEIEKTYFPMKLSVRVDEYFILFDNVSKEDFMGYIFLRDSPIVFLLEDIPKGDRDRFRENSYPIDETYHISLFNKKFQGSEVTDVLNVEIEFKDSDGKLHVASISFPRIEVERISFGIFLKKYGKDILNLFRENIGGNKKQIPSYSSGPAFPMLLKFFDYKKSDAGFNSENRDQTLLWNSRNNILVLCSESDENKLSNAVSDVDDLIPNCVICHDPLHNKVHVARKPDLHLPVLDGYNTTQFPCAHCFHTHCIIRAIIGGLQRCPLCRNEPDDRWWRSMYSVSYYYLRECVFSTYRKLNTAKTEKKDKEAEDLQLIATEIHEEFNFVSSKTRSSLDSAGKLLMRCQLYNPPNPDGFQRLNLLLDRNLERDFN